MNDRFVLRALISALVGHGVGVLVLLLLSFLSLSFDNPSTAVLPCAFVALGMGAVVTGIMARRAKSGIPAALLAAFFFAVIPFAVSLFGKSDFFTLGVRFLVVLCALVLTGAVALLFPASKKRRKRRPPRAQRR